MAQKDLSMVGFNLKTGISDTPYFANEDRNIYPIHLCSSEIKKKLCKETHHYVGIFTKDIFASLPATIYIGKMKFDVHKTKRILLISYDGKLNLWQCCPTFYSECSFIPGTPIFDSNGSIVSIITGKKGNTYAISCFDGCSGKLETNHDWEIIHAENGLIYGNRVFPTREQLQEYLENRKFTTTKDLQAVLVVATIPRIILYDRISGLEVAHSYIRGDFAVEIADCYF